MVLYLLTGCFSVFLALDNGLVYVTLQSLTLLGNSGLSLYTSIDRRDEQHVFLGFLFLSSIELFQLLDHFFFHFLGLNDIIQFVDLKISDPHDHFDHSGLESDSVSCNVFFVFKLLDNRKDDLSDSFLGLDHPTFLLTGQFIEMNALGQQLIRHLRMFACICLLVIQIWHVIILLAQFSSHTIQLINELFDFIANTAQLFIDKLLIFCSILCMEIVKFPEF